MADGADPHAARAALVSVKPGDVLAGKFRVERVIGAGGMGVVVAATHLQLDQLVALKFLLPEAARNKDVAMRFAREARAAAKIRSEHVARAVDVGMLDSGEPYIVMEFLEGSDLGSLLEKQGRLDPTVVVDYVLQACEAIAEAHAYGIVHRDLKPENLFLAQQPDGSEIIKVLDFGISKAMPQMGGGSDPSVTKTTDVFGSPTYMSPEQLRASRDVDARADIWALGAIVYELLTGSPPFGGGTVAEVFGAILYKPTPAARAARPDIPLGLEAVITRCLDKSPDARFADMAELATALAPFGGQSAQQSTARVARVMSRKAGSPKRDSSATAPAVATAPTVASQPSLTDVQARASTAVARSQDAAPATGTAWVGVEPRRPGRGRARLVAAVAAATVLVGLPMALWVLRAPATEPLSPSPAQGASAETPPPPVAEPAPTVAPAAPATAAADSAPTATVEPTAQPTSTPAKAGAKRPPSAAAPPRGAAPSSAAGKTGAPTATAAPTPAAAATDDWGGSRK